MKIKAVSINQLIETINMIKKIVQVSSKNPELY